LNHAGAHLFDPPPRHRKDLDCDGIMLDGVTDGTPPLHDEAARQRWVQVCTTA